MKRESGYYWVKVTKDSDWMIFMWTGKEFKNPIYMPSEGKYFFEINPTRIKSPDEQ